jgi:mannonate dehydratase
MNKHLTYFDHSAGLSRRAAAKIAMGGAGAVASLGALRASNALAAEVKSDIKLTINWQSKPTDDELKFLNEVGYKNARANAPNGGKTTVEEMKALKKRYADYGISLDSLQYLQGGEGGDKLVQLLLDLPGREQAVKDIQEWIRKNAQAGYNYVGGNLMVTGVWSSGQVDIRGGAKSRRFDPTSPDARGSGEFGKPRPAGGIDTLYYGRPYGYDEVMSNFKKYFVGQVVPVLEENKVFFALHPDDPPVFKSLGGVDRVMNSYANYKKMFAAANDSPYVGIQMCCGTYNEGGELMGATLPTVLRELWARKKFKEIHFRNISSGPVNGKPHFDEVFMDSGYYDMYKIMKTLVDMGYDGYLHLDHTPAMVGAPYTYAAYSMGFMKAVLVRALAEPKANFP